MRFKSVENCGGDNQIVTLDKNFTAILTPDCQVTSVGCITSKGFTKATARYSIVKNGMPIISGNPDLCAALDKKGEEAKAKLEMFGFPTECPFPEGRKCMDGQKKLSIAKFKKFLSMAAGKMEIEADILHDTVSETDD